MSGQRIIGARLKERREVVGISQAELARRTQLHQSTINELERKGGNSRYIHRIVRVVQTTPAYLTGETDDPESDVPDDALTAEERELLELMRSLGTADRQVVDQLVRRLSEPGKPATVHAPGAAYHTAARGARR